MARACCCAIESGRSDDGTISLYDRDGERLHTIYVGAPEYGKATFFRAYDPRDQPCEKAVFQARYAGIADGLQRIGFSETFIDEEILDFYHATQYWPAQLRDGHDEGACKTWLDEACHDLKHKRHAAKNLLHDMQKVMDTTKTLKPEMHKKLQAAITYFSNHLHKWIMGAMPPRLSHRFRRHRSAAKPWSNNACAAPACAGPRQGRGISSAFAPSSKPIVVGSVLAKTHSIRIPKWQIITSQCSRTQMK